MNLAELARWTDAVGEGTVTHPGVYVGPSAKIGASAFSIPTASSTTPARGATA